MKKGLRKAAAGTARMQDTLDDALKSGTDQVGASFTGGKEDEQQQVNSLMALYNKTKGRDNNGKKAE